MADSGRKKALFILSQLNNDDIDWIVQKSKKEVLEPGAILIFEGRLIDALYIILDGILSVSVEGRETKEIAKIGSGELVGEVSFIDARPPLATVKAIEETHLLAIPRRQLVIKLENDMGFASRFYYGISLCLADRMRGTIRHIEYGRSIEFDQPELEEDINPSIIENLALAQAKFNWLRENIKD
ncbi:cyclic nucleotide-binding domain-containing protein [Microcoleus sp. LEGE 07076]|uniref:cyclic nucleotide-binding domain-containing protein n=1 Tax=Microcoleus sp. LEGE 07076 TaxID=915322 RepID=UPI00187E201E|nr:cyclic nucleotide-binding domain-containing protein [Microcoleus sp. LEGE 07076]MBE9185592.1 cyclic nucleotide-binding domain-containing protein [Microcoleus sp. LEGE 07076]